MMTTPEKPMTPMTECPSKDDLRSLSLGILSGEDSDILLQHLDDCGSCQSDLETMNDVEDSLIAGLRENVCGDSVDSEPQRDLALAKALGALAEAHQASEVENTEDFPSSIGEYEIVRPLGSGGMGRVFLARHTKLGREVALKVIADHRLSDSTVRKRFEQEMQAIGRLSHPNIVTAHDAREIDSTAVLVTEYIDGLDLGQIVRRGGPLSVANACQAAKQVAVALQYTGNQGFVHRDIKPQNVMVSRTGQVKLLDLGLARIHSDDSARTGMTGTGQTMGTADYVSPEQVTDSREVDIRSDLYSLGCTLFKLLTGQAPYASERHATAYAKMNAHVSEQPPNTSEFRDDVPKSIVKLLNELMAKKPDKRPAEPMAVARALEPFCEGSDLELLVQGAMDSGTNFEHESNAGVADSTESKVTEPMPWWQRRVPMTVAIATGLCGAFLGAVFGILITIKSKDGTTVAQVKTEKGSLISVEEVDDVPAEKVAESGTVETADPAESLGPVIPLMFGVLKVDPIPEFEGKGVLVHNIATSGSEFTEVIEDKNCLWFPVSDDFDSTPTKRINGRPHVAVYKGRSNQLRWSDLLGHILSLQSNMQGIQVKLDEEAGEQMGFLTRKNVNKKLAVIIDGEVVSSPRILSAITNEFVITGNLNPKQIRALLGSLDSSRWSPSKAAAVQVKLLQTQLAEKAKTDDQAKAALEQINIIIRQLETQGNANKVAPERPDSAQVRLNLKEIGIAFHNYNSVFGKFPASAGPPRNGKEIGPPVSWRVAILPFIEGQKLYEEYKFDEPWDSEHNIKFLDRMPDVFKPDNSDTPRGHTHIQGFAGDDRAMGIKEGFGFRDILDGTSNTALLVETADSVPWTKPQDVTDTPKLPKDNVRIVMADGRILQLPNIDPELLKKMITRSGSEMIDPSIFKSDSP